MIEIGCSKLEWSSLYLGVPLGGNSSSIHFWKRVENKVAKHFKSCMSKIPDRVADRTEGHMRVSFARVWGRIQGSSGELGDMISILINIFLFVLELAFLILLVLISYSYYEYYS